jgi:hypothetical protein
MAAFIPLAELRLIATLKLIRQQTDPLATVRHRDSLLFTNTS